jgi:2-oxoglutarate/2-oxoacid ferredoxin oxidoreductase subunit beta
MTPDGNGHPGADDRDGAGGTLTLTKKDFASDQEVRWCPGCGDYAILSTVQAFMPELGIPPHRMVFVTGIGCSGRFVYYMDTYGIHSIHGRAPAIATGLATARPDLSVWIVTGDGDALSIGGNHLIHALRKNINVKILMFNNQIYGLTKGQYSPTSEEGKVTKSTPFGSLDHPFNPVALALGAEATFVARTIDNDRQHLTSVLRAAAQHQGAAFIEIYQNCNVFNDGAFDFLREKQQGAMQHQIRLEDGKPVTFGPNGERCVYVEFDGTLQAGDTADTPEELIYVHDVHRENPATAFALAHVSSGPTTPTAIGVFRDHRRPVYGELMEQQIAAATDKLGQGDLTKLLHSGDTWTVG